MHAVFVSPISLPIDAEERRGLFVNLCANLQAKTAKEIKERKEKRQQRRLAIAEFTPTQRVWT